MKIKNISPLEAHYEKLLLVLGLIVLGLSALFYGMDTPNVVKIGGKELKPQEIDPEILKEANRLKSALDNKDLDPKMLEMKVPSYARNFEEKLAKPVTALAEFPATLGPVFGMAGTVVDGNSPYYEPQIPAPTIAGIAADMAVVDAQEVAANLELAQMLPKGAPADISWVSLKGVFDMATMLAELNKFTEEPRTRKLESIWWQNSFAIADVQIERQEQNPAGEWSDSKIVGVLPGAAFDPRQVPQDVDLQVAAGLVAHIRKHQIAILQPPFPQLRDRTWNAPAEGVEPNQEGAAGELLRAKRALDDKEKVLATAKASLERLELAATRRAAGAAKTKSSSQPDSTTPPEPITESEGEGVAGGAVYTASAADTTKAIANMKARVDELTKQRNAALEVFKKLLPPAAPGKSPDAADAGIPGGETQGTQNLMQMRSVDLWASDLTVKPGSTYRYRMRVRVINPLFKKSEPPEEQRKKHLKSFLADGPWSEWSKPVLVPDKFHYFFTGATPRPTQATVEVWKFYDGAWRSAEFRLKPGDPVGERRMAGKVDVDFSTGNYLIDVYFTKIKSGNVVVEAGKALMMEGDRVATRLVDEDKNKPKLQELRAAALGTRGGGQ
jgi:hypothetical protein